MWISKIELSNFKSYQQQTFEFPAPEQNKNIVLIGGMNGYGKTSILEALYLCLYGKDAIVHLARAGLKTDEIRGYPSFLERAFNGEALRGGKEIMMVRVVINRTKTKAVEITRKWYFRSNGNWSNDEEALVRDVIRDIPETPRIDGKNGFVLAHLLEDILVPAHVAPFFFFDGEEVKKLADQGRLEQVKQGLEGLLGVVLLRELAGRLRAFEGNKRNGVENVDEKNLERVLQTLTSDESELAELKQKTVESDAEQARLKGERDALLERITAAGGGGGDIATVKELVEEREQYRSKLKQIRGQLENVLSGELPFHLVSKEVLSAFREQLLGEIRYHAWEADKRSLLPRKMEFEKAFLNAEKPVIAPELTDEQIAAIRARIETAWESLFYPPPNDCADTIVHGYFHDHVRQQVLDFLGTLSLGQGEVIALLREQNDLQGQIDELARKISRIEGIDRDGTLAVLKSQLQEAQNRLDVIADENRDVDRKINALDARVKAERATYEGQRKALDASSPARALIDKSTRVQKAIDELIPALFPLKVRALGTAMTSVYKQLAHKDQVHRIEIRDNGTTRILGVSGKEITFDRSAGENQIFATALIAGLAKVSRGDAPMIVDTPMSRLDSKHRTNILKFWTSDTKRQVILLSQDKEVDRGLLNQIKENVSKTYLLEHQNVGDGIGRTTAKADAYFR